MFMDEIEVLMEVCFVNYFSGFYIFYLIFVSGKGVVLFKIVEDYENNLFCYKDYIVIFDCVIGKFCEGMESGVFEIKLIIDCVIKQFNIQLVILIKELQFWGLIIMFLESFFDEEKVCLIVDYEKVM